MTTATATKSRTKGPVTANEVRTWAVEKGLTVGSRGTLPASIVEAFNKGRKRKFA